MLSQSSTVLTARLSNSRPGVGVLTMRVDMVNQRDEPVFAYEVAGLYECRPETA